VNNRKAFGALLAVAAVFLIFFVFFQFESEVSSPSGPVVQSMMKDGEDQVARDMVAQYQIAARSGTAMDRCVQAGMVTAGFLQAKDEKNYSEWKTVQHRDCKAAGLPDMF
jgi:hypothetical protein